MHNIPNTIGDLLWQIAGAVWLLVSFAVVAWIVNAYSNNVTSIIVLHSLFCILECICWYMWIKMNIEKWYFYVPATSGILVLVFTTPMPLMYWPEVLCRAISNV